MFVTASVYLKVSVILIMIHHVRFFSRLNEQVSWVFIVHSSHLFVARGRAEREVTSIAAAGCWWRTFAWRHSRAATTPRAQHIRIYYIFIRRKKKEQTASHLTQELRKRKVHGRKKNNELAREIYTFSGGVINAQSHSRKKERKKEGSLTFAFNKEHLRRWDNNR